MDAVHVSKDAVTISVNLRELAFLCNAINETFEALEDWEFHPRVGATVDEAKRMHDELSKLLNEAHLGGDEG